MEMHTALLYDFPYYLNDTVRIWYVLCNLLHLRRRE